MLTWHEITNPTIYEQNRFDEISDQEGVSSLPYLDTKSIPSIGIGFNLRVDSIRDAVFIAIGLDLSRISPTDSAALTAEQGYINQLESAVNQSYNSANALQNALNVIMAQRAADPVLASYTHITSHPTFMMEDPEIVTVFNEVIPDYEATLDAWLPGISQSDERLALLSLTYNGLIGFNQNGSLKSPALHQALIADNRAEAWYEIRYRSNADGEHASRRYAESDQFNLYDNAPLTEVEAKSIFRMYTVHRDVIQAYESDPLTAPGSTDTFAYESQNARTLLVATYAQGQTINGDVLVGADLPIPGDYLTGTDNNDLIFGENGNDILKGGAGDDVILGGAGTDQITGGLGDDLLKGGQGYDTYIYSINDGQDTISDSDGLGSILYDSHLVVGGIHRATDAPNTYVSLDGTFTFYWNGPSTDLTINNLITVQNFSSGQLGITLIDAPTIGAPTRTEFLKVDHYDLDSEGNPTIPVYVPAFDDNDNNWFDVANPPMGNDNNLIHAGGGNDLIITGTGDDQLFGEAGNDEISGMAGNDSLMGGEGNDFLSGDDANNPSAPGGDDVLDGGAGDDDLAGGVGDDLLMGGTGNDQLHGEGNGDFTTVGNDWLDGGEGSDDIEGDGGNDVLIGGEGNDFLFGDDDPLASVRVAGNDVLDGGEGNDQLFGGLGDDILSGGMGNDQLLGDSVPLVSLVGGDDGNDVLDGGEGDDTLEGDGGDDELFGGTGNDTLIGDDPHTGGNDFGNDFLDGGEGNDTLFGQGGADTLAGGDGNDELQGGDGDEDDVLSGGGGVDTLFGDAGDDVLSGDAGDDQLFGGTGNDALDGGGGEDYLAGGYGSDTLAGGVGNDTYFVVDAAVQIIEEADGGADTVISVIDFTLGATSENLTITGNVVRTGTGNALDNVLTVNGVTTVLITLVGGAGNDTYVVDNEYLVVEQAGEGIDTVMTIDSHYTLGANVENLTLTGTGLAFFVGTGNELDNVLTGSFGSANVLDGGAGADTMIGGVAGDLYKVDDVGDVVTENVGEGIDQVSSSVTYTLSADVENLTLTVTAAVDGTGNELDNVLTGNSAANVLTGGAGSDTYVVGVGDTVVENANEGTDTVQSSVSFTLGANVENLTLTGSGAINGTGNELDNVLTGNNGANVLTGGAGNDTYVVGAGDTVVEAANEGIDTVQSSVTFTLGANVENLTLTESSAINGTGNELDNVLTGNGAANVLTGGAGNDTYVVGAGDTVVENANEGTDTVQSSATFTLSTNVENLTLTGSSAINGTGNELDNVLTGNSADNALNGEAGADTLIGGTGNDTYVIGAGDTVVEAANEGIDTVQSDLTYTLGANVEKLTLTGSSAINGTGNELDNVLVGNSGANVLEGGAGSDQMSGGAGNDTYVVGIGDSVIENLGEGVDTVQSAASYTLSANVENLTLTGTASINGTGNELNNVLAGNAGNNVLIGSEGNDTYLFGLGSGQDVIIDVDVTPGNLDTVLMSAGIVPGDVTVAHSGADLVITIANSPDQLTVQSYAQDDANKIERIQFADGTTWNAPAVANPITDQTTAEDAAFTFQVPATAFADVDVGDTFTYSASLADGSALPAWLSFDAATRTFSGTPDDPQVGTVNLQVTVIDTTNLSASDTFTLTVTNVNEAPTVANPIEDQTANGGVVFAFTVPANTFADVDVGDTFTYSASLADGSALPGWLSFNAATHTFSGMPASGDAGVVSVRVTTIDTGSLSASDAFDLTVTPGQVIVGTAGDDVLTGAGGNDLLYGLAGNDTLDGGAGTDTMVGGAGNDTYYVDNTGDVVTENVGEGIDQVSSSVTYTLSADVENLTLTGAATISGTGNELDNRLDGSQNSAANVLTGDLGNDTYVVGAGDSVVENTNGGTDTVQSSVSFTLSANVENLTLTGTAAINGTGNTLANVLTGNSGANILDGGTGADTLIGKAGDDTYYVDNTGDVVTENAGEGTDAVQSSVTFTLSADVENLTLTGAAAINATGNALDNVLTGNSATNTLTGLGGNDTYIVQNTGDVVVEAVGAGTDTVQSSVTFTLGANVENLTLTGTAAINATGNTLNNVLDGNQNSAANVLTGSAGDDTYVVGAGDTVVEASGGGTDTVVAHGVTSYTLGSNVDNLTLADDSYYANGTGNTLNNLLTGNAYDNTLDGGTGADTMVGGLGNDSYWVDNTGDVIIENAGGGTDRVISVVTYTLSVTLENLWLWGSLNINGTGNELSNLLYGNSGANILDGGAGADSLYGFAGNDTYIVDNPGDYVWENFNEGTDTIQSSVTYSLVYPSYQVENLTLTGTAEINGTGNDLNNILIGNSGNNVLDGGALADTMIGGDGNDTYIVDNTGDVVTESASADIDLVQSSATYTLSANVENLTLTGSSAINGTGNTLDNVLDGSQNSAANVLTGGAGNDTYIVGTGDSVVEGASAGTDTVQSAVTFTLSANVENLTLTGGTAINGTGNTLDNVLTGNTGTNALTGLGGNDTYIVQNTGDVVVEAVGAGTDTVQSSVTFTLGANVENLTLTESSAINGTGNELDNVLTGNNGDNTLTGDFGNDTLDGGIGVDTLQGGAGDDTYILDTLSDVVTENMGEGTDTVQIALTYTLGANVENLTLTGSAAINGSGNALGNVLTGNSAANVLTGGVGNDTYYVDNTGDVVTESTGEGTDTVNSTITYTLADKPDLENLTLMGSTAINGTGNELDNVLTGNSGANALTGGAGNDTYVVGAGDTVVENANEGTDMVQSAQTYTLASLGNVENLTLTGNNVINGTGNDLDNVLTGNDKDNVLDGGPGADTLIGGERNDTYVVDNAGDVVVENSGEGFNDQVNSSVTYTLSANVENLTLTGSSAINGMGNSAANVLTGNSADNVLDGGAGSDTLQGDAGNDTYIVDNTGDIVTESAGEGTDQVNSSATYTLSVNVENMTLTGSSAINGTGNTLDNVLDGSQNSAANVLTGGAGNDTYIVGTGDSVVEGASAGTDTVQSAVTFTLSANVENLTLTGTAAINGTGNGSANVLVGNSGNNILDGGVGVDTLQGGADDDTYVLDTLSDVVTENVGEGTDTVQIALTGYTLSANVENLTLTGSSAINGTGNSLDNLLTGNSAPNTLTGSSGNDTLDGGVGADTMTGGSGNDTYIVDNVGDVVTSDSSGTDTVFSSVTFTLNYLDLENLTLTGSSNIDGTGSGGGSGANILIGNSGNNVLDGKGGNDTLDGGAGADTLLGWKDDDTLIFDPSDSIVDGQGDIDTLRVDGGLDLDLVTTGALSNIEKINLTGSGSILTVSIQDVLDLSETNQLQVDGNSDDSILNSGSGWSFIGQVDIQGNLYNQYSGVAGSNTATLLVDADIAQSGLI